MISQSHIKKNLLNQLNFFNYGFSDLYMDHSAKRLISLDQKENVAYGVDDRYGNYFYLRNDGNVRVSQGEKIIESSKNLLLTNTIVLVANVSNAYPEKLLECLLNYLGIQDDIIINSAQITNEKVINSEYPLLDRAEKNIILSQLHNRTLVKLEFISYSTMQPNERNCYECNPCKNC
ncbi:Uncharacterised protein [Weeksella virosa]|uniref:Uncharacterized protein n=2 Tax=Weeksella virosa TaxID=1014 RepID=F0NXQ4_WEEVC|nr:hypothetical protein Weevi_0239 [Weeksella virosa DSM 16922]VEH63310.1 Uncharacterised protein [Weeksella virosa]